MFKKFMMVCALATIAIPAMASRGGNVRIEVKDLKSVESRSRVADKVSLTLRDYGSSRLSSVFSRVINEEVGRLDVNTQAKFAKSVEAFLEAVRVHNSNRASSIQLAKLENVSETLLTAAVAIRSNSVQNAKTQEIADLLFSFLGPRLKEKLENESLEYDINKMEKVAQIVLTSELSKRSITVEEIDAIYKELTTLLNAKNLREVEEC